LVVLALALVEVVGHFVIRARVPEPSDWSSAADFVRKRVRETDALGVTPEWASPLLRHHLGDRISLAEAGRSDLARYERLWALSLRGHLPDEAPSTEPTLERRFGRITVYRWPLGPSPVVYDLTGNIRDAKVSYVDGGKERPCPWKRGGRRGRFGLGQGPVWPPQRFQCDPRRRFLFVAPTVTEDLHLEPRYCIWQHPKGREPVRVSFEDVPLGERLVLYGGLYYEHERKREGAPVHVAVKVNGSVVGRMVHRDGDGWKRMEARTAPEGPGEPKGGAERGRITIEVTSPEPEYRSFCWNATVRSGSRRGGPER
jgi:hypothetical protein